jgi:hypothetical protein
LSISSSTTTANPAIFSHHELNYNSVIAKQNTNIVKDVGITGPLWRKKEIMEIPLTNKIIENPTQITKVIEEIVNVNKTINLPTNVNSSGDDVGKQAKNGLIMIRRAKMRKHKLRKLRKKMKFLWAKVSLIQLLM